MKNKILNFLKDYSNIVLIGIVVLMFTSVSCDDVTYPSFEAATVNTESVTDITGSSAISGGVIISDGGDAISTRGICWDSIENPTIGDAVSLDTLGLEKFTGHVSGLKGGTKYYVRAFATNNGGISYGENEVFTTNVVPYLTTNVPTDITGISATGGGVITESFGAQIVERGVCWGLTVNPSIDDSKTKDGSGDAPFTSQITGLLPSTTYHVRAYATTSDGDTGYGNDVMFDTQILDYDGNVYTSVKIGETVWMVENFISTHYNDGTPIDAAGIAWHADDVNHEYGLNYLGSVMLNPKFAPKGWHVPTKDEWDALFAYVENDMNKLKETGTDHWNLGTGTNETGFTALGSAHIYGEALKGSATWWTSTVDDNGIPWRYVIIDDGSLWGGHWNGPEFAFTVRLVKD